MFILRQASLKMAILLHTVANWWFIMIIAVPRYVHLHITLRVLSYQPSNPKDSSNVACSQKHSTITLQIFTSLLQLISRNPNNFLLCTSARCTYDIRYLYQRCTPDVLHQKVVNITTI